MTLLWLAFAILLMPALWLLVAPLRRAAVVCAAQRDFEANDRSTDQNLAIYRHRLASLQAARERGDIDDARLEEDRLELERSLLEDTEHLARRPLRAAGAGRLMVPVIMVALVTASVLWYQQEGAEDDLALYAAQQAVINDPDGSRAMMIERLENQAERQADNPNVWKALFPLYRDAGRIEAATASLERLIALEGHEPPLLAELAQIRFFAAGREMTDQVQALADEALEKDPGQPTVLGMLGIAAYDSGGFAQAIELWRRAIAGMNGSSSADALREGIRVAQQRMGVTPDDVEVAAAEGPGIRVRVRLAPDLAPRVEDNARVFIVARDMAGELPPLAVAQLRVGDLPTSVVLDDHRSMLSEATLSQVNEARLIVRISLSGQASPQPGDLFGSLDGVAVGSLDDPVELTVDRVVE